MITGKHLLMMNEVSDLIESLSRCFRIKTTVYSPNMEESLVAPGNQESTYCSLIQSKLKLREKCLELDRQVCESCMGKKVNARIYSCHAGMCEYVYPVYVNDSLLCYVVFGQFRVRKRIPQSIIELAKKAGVEREKVLSSFESSPYYSRNELELMVNVFADIVRLLIMTKAIDAGKCDSTQNALVYIKQNISTPTLSASEIARALGLSVSTLSRYVKKDTGRSLYQNVIQMRIEMFENILKKNPDYTIQQASADVGYPDPLYFSRIYRKVRNQTPSEFKKNCKTE